MLLAIAVATCNRPSHDSSSHDDNAVTVAPRGRWRLAPRSELGNVTLWLSHIVVSHRDAQWSEVPFGGGDWFIHGQPPTRSREDALGLAREIAAKARKVPHNFANLAKRYSDDATTQSEGGSLGGVTAVTFVLWPRILDALATIGLGDVSDIVETQYGFHIFLMREHPPLQQISAQRIVIGHDDATFLTYARRGTIAKRTRGEALSLAQTLVARLRDSPAIFDELVATHSEHRDAEQGGDIGVWTNHEPSPFGREIEVLSRLSTGQISGPIDSPFGFQIFKRTEVVPRQSYAMQPIRVAFDPGAPANEKNSKEAMQALASSVAVAIQDVPERFEKYQKEFNSSG
jgi:parvulin-like peptidyl-prolyl isomerase